MRTIGLAFVLSGLMLIVLEVQGQNESPACPPCDVTTCEKVTDVSCPAGILMDECGCCQLCARSLRQSCGGSSWSLGRCGRAYFCQGPNPRMPIDIGRGETGVCMCREEKKVCGSDGRVYESICALNETTFNEERRGATKIEPSKDKSICRSASVITLITPRSSTVLNEGQQTYMQCEGEGFPTPSITWLKDGVVLPGDKTNIAVQAIGGPRENQATGWLLISRVNKDDSGEYTCEVTNHVGEAVRETIQVQVARATGTEVE